MTEKTTEKTDYNNSPYEITPIIIKGKDCTPGVAPISASCFEISGLDFAVKAVKDESASNSKEWTESVSVDEINGIESIVIGDPGPLHQYCSTAHLDRPLTVKFISKDDHDRERVLFTIKEGAIPNGSENCNLTISVPADSSAYFTIKDGSLSDWTVSEVGFSSPIDIVMVTTGSYPNEKSQCRLIKLAEPIYVNYFPSTLDMVG
jgi:hypothetical protein